MQRALLAALLLAASTFPAAQALPQQQLDALMALARVHGVVRYFHPADSVEQVKWAPFVVHAADSVRSVNDLEPLYAPIVEGFRVVAEGTPTVAPQGDGPRIEWRHLGFGVTQDANSPYVSWRTHHEPLHGAKVKGSYFQHRAGAETSVHAQPVMRVALGGGLEAHVPVSLPMSAAKIGEAQKARLDELQQKLDSVKLGGEPVTRAQAHADGIVLWNVARHFYPYWPQVKVDWEVALRKWLAEQPETQTRAQLRDSLRRLAAPLEDGHVHVRDGQDSSPRAFLPISVRPLAGQWVIDASQVPDKVRAGDVVIAVDGTPAAKWFEQRLALVSGSPQHRPWAAVRELTSAAKGTSVTLRLARGRETLDVTLAYEAPRPLQGPRPAAIHEVKPGIHYVDVSRFQRGEYEKALETLKSARAIIFDLRGYPSRDAFGLVSHWLSGEDKAQWMFVPRYDKPYAESNAAWSIGWQVTRNPALEKPMKLLLTDGRAISYSESLAAYFPDLRIGPVVGERTAGTNGNVARAALPSGMQFFFTTMRVTRHDGTTLVHREGIAPDHAVTPTVDGIRAGRDEILEAAISLAEKRP